MTRVRRTGDIMRKAGSTTLILQILSAVLLLVMIGLFVDISRQFRFLQDGVRENAVWSVYQLDREARALGDGLAELRRQPSSKALRDDLTLRNDIFFERAQQVKESQFSGYFTNDPRILQLLLEIEKTVVGLQSALDGDALSRMPSAAELEGVDIALTGLAKLTGDLLVQTNRQLNAERAVARTTILELERTAAIMLALLMISVVFLVVTLRRQLKSVRKAGRELEGMARRLTEAYEAADAGNRAKSQFMATMGHEIRTPLNAIIGFADMMANEHFGTLGHPRYAEYANDIVRSGRHVLDIVNDLLDISKIEAGEMDLDFTAVGLNETVQAAVSIIQPQANGQRVIIRTALSQAVPNVVADMRSIKQIVLNILANAIRFTPSGGQIIVSTAYEANGSVALRIRDTGIGMTRTELEQAMKPFRQVQTGPTHRGDGTGLGLPLTKAMVDANRANFSISSSPNEGTLVEITFPSQRVLAD